MVKREGSTGKRLVRQSRPRTPHVIAGRDVVALASISGPSSVNREARE